VLAPSSSGKGSEPGGRLEAARDTALRLPSVCASLPRGPPAAAATLLPAEWTAGEARLPVRLPSSSMESSQGGAHELIWPYGLSGVCARMDSCDVGCLRELGGKMATAALVRGRTASLEVREGVLVACPALAMRERGSSGVARPGVIGLGVIGRPGAPHAGAFGVVRWGRTVGVGSRGADQLRSLGPADRARGSSATGAIGVLGRLELGEALSLERPEPEARRSLGSMGPAGGEGLRSRAPLIPSPPLAARPLLMLPPSRGRGLDSLGRFAEVRAPAVLDVAPAPLALLALTPDGLRAAGVAAGRGGEAVSSTSEAVLRASEVARATSFALREGREALDARG